MNEMTPVRRMTAKDFPQELLDLYDFYAHGKITKREFMNGAAKFAVGGLTAAMLLDQLSPNYALAQQVAPDDAGIVTERITYPSPNGHGEVNGYLVKPAGATGKLPAVLVVHENRGLNPYIEDVARRLGKAGFMALAPDGLTSVGGYPGSDDQGRELQRTVDGTKLMNDFFAGFSISSSVTTAPARLGRLVSATAAVWSMQLRSPIRSLPRACLSMDVSRILRMSPRSKRP